MKTTIISASVSSIVSVWHQADWNGPTVEVRPENTPDSAEWPEGAAERVLFTLEQFPDVAYPDELPYWQFYGTDGWALCTPEHLKSQIDPRMQAEFRLYPWGLSRWSERTWPLGESGYERFIRFNLQAGLIHNIQPFLPKP